jgi:hypothetical protein
LSILELKDANIEVRYSNMVSTQSDALRPAPPTPGDVRHQLRRILDNGPFLRSPRVSRFLRFVVESALADTTAELKESVIGIEVFDLEADYNPQENPVVRNTAVRLRLKLEAYYHGDGSTDPVLIELPLGRYVPFFTWRALAPAAAPLEADPELHKQVRAVGRDREFEQLRSALRGVLRGQRQVVKVSGDAGLGKTTLVEEFLRGIEDSVWILKGRCSESLSRNEAYVAVLEALDTLIHNPLGEQTVSMMGEYAPSWLAQVLPGKAAESRTGAVRSQEKMRREFAHFVRVLCRLRPAILFLDDMHWADASTCDLLSYLQGISADFRLLVVLTFRPAELVSTPHPFRALEVELSRQGGSDIFLRPLNALDVEAYIHRGFPVNSFPSDLGRIVFERTEGHPLFMADVVGHLRESGLVAAVNGRWEMTAQADLLRSLVPATTQRLIRLQIDQLTAERVRILECAAVQGARFDTAVVATALGLDQALWKRSCDAWKRNVASFPARRICGRIRTEGLFYIALHTPCINRSSIVDSPAGNEPPLAGRLPTL